MISDKKLKSIEAEGKIIKLKIFKKFCEVKEGHPGSVLSIFDIINLLYLGKFIKISNNVKNNDKLLISKGHAASIQYPYLVKFGLIPKKEWEKWPKEKSIFKVFTNINIPGIDVTSGSLGYGIGIAIGYAIALKQKKTRKKIYVILSEGELYEGSIWEAFIFLAHHKLLNIKIIIDVNRNIILGNPDNCLKLEPIKTRIEGFGFKTMTINGHCYKEINKGLNFLNNNENVNKILLANTIKGKGVSFMENKPESHYWSELNSEKLKILINDLSS